MIRLSAETAAQLTADTLPALKLRGLLAAYGAGWDFLPFWEDDAGGAGALLAGTAVVCPAAACREEWAVFLSMQPPVKAVETDPATAAVLRPFGFTEIQRPVLRLPPLVGETADTPPLSEVYPLLQQVFGAEGLPPFDTWYADMSHRLRHGAGLATGVRQGDTLVSVALVTALSPAAGLVSGVATAPAYRGQGLARRCVATLTAALQDTGRTAYICPKNAAADALYRRWGAVEVGTLSLLSRGE